MVRLLGQLLLLTPVAAGISSDKFLPADQIFEVRADADELESKSLRVVNPTTYGQQVPAKSGGFNVNIGEADLDLSFRCIGVEGILDLPRLLDRKRGIPVSGPLATSNKAEGHVHTQCGSVPDHASHVADGEGLLALDLRHCSLGDAGVSALVTPSIWTQGPADVASLSLRHNQMTARGARALLDALRRSDSHKLRSLELDFNTVGDAGLQSLPAYLKHRGERGAGGLHELSLKFCSIGPTGCRYLSSALAKAASAISRGVIEDQAASQHPEEDDAERIASPGIRRLLLTGNQLGDDGARILAAAIRNNRSLQMLDLAKCEIGNDGARYLADALRSNSCLRELRLGHNDISADGANAFAALLADGGSTLEVLDLRGNKIGDIGAECLSEGLLGYKGDNSSRSYRHRRSSYDHRQGRGRGLRRLDLSNCGLGCVGACALARAIEGSNSNGKKTTQVVLEDLQLAGNALTLSAAENAQASKSSLLYKSAGGALSSLINQFIDDSYRVGTTIPDSPALSLNPGQSLRCGVTALGRALRRGQSPLKRLGLARTGITEGDALRLVAALRHRPAGDHLECVDVGMNELLAATVEAVRAAVKYRTGQAISSNKPAGPSIAGRRARPEGSSTLSDASDDAGAEVESHKAQRGKVELEMLRKKLTSFRQPVGSNAKLDVEVFGKRVSFDSGRMVSRTSSVTVSAEANAQIAVGEGSDGHENYGVDNSGISEYDDEVFSRFSDEDNAPTDVSVTDDGDDSREAGDVEHMRFSQEYSDHGDLGLWDAGHAGYGEGSDGFARDGDASSSDAYISDGDHENNADRRWEEEDNDDDDDDDGGGGDVSMSKSRSGVRRRAYHRTSGGGEGGESGERPDAI